MYYPPSPPRGGLRKVKDLKVPLGGFRGENMENFRKSFEYK
jgi:hypothetical protein